MPSNKPTDELLAALPEVGLWLCALCQHADGWGAMVADDKPNPKTWSAKGDTPAGALIAALKEAGVDATDDTA